MGQLRQLALYVLIPAAGLMSPLLVIPAVTSRFGAGGWTSMALAQALGGAAAVAGQIGWGVAGPQRVAGMSAADGVAQYRLSLTSRPIVVLPAVLLVAIASYLLAAHDSAAAAVLAGGTAAQAMSPQWYFVGTGRPVAVLWSESLPKILLALLSALALRAGAPFITFSLLTCLSVPVMLLVGRRLIGPDSTPGPSDWSAAPATARSQLVMGSGLMINVLYIGLPVSIVQVVAPAATPVFAATERLMRMGASVLHSIPARLQSWIGSAPPNERALRIRRAQRICLSVGIFSGVAYAALAPTISRLVFSGEVDIPYPVAAASGLLLAVICTTMGLGLAMVATGQANLITAATIPAAVVALAGVGPMARWHGPAGGVIAEVTAELAGVGVQWYFLRRYAHRGQITTLTV